MSLRDRSPDPRPRPGASKSALRWAVVKLVSLAMIALADARAGRENGDAVHRVAVGLAVLVAIHDGWLIHEVRRPS